MLSQPLLMTRVAVIDRAQLRAQYREPARSFGSRPGGHVTSEELDHTLCDHLEGSPSANVGSIATAATASCRPPSSSTPLATSSALLGYPERTWWSRS